jgi:hypothetical protein
MAECQSEEGPAIPYWMVKNVKGDDFQRKMHEGHVKVQNVYGQCRKVGEDSKQKRRPPTTAYTDAIRSRIEAAKAVSQFANGCVQPDCQTNARISNTAAGSSRFDAENVPGFIGHLVVPTPSGLSAELPQIAAPEDAGVPGQVFDSWEEGDYPISPARGGPMSANTSELSSERIQTPQRALRQSMKDDKKSKEDMDGFLDADLPSCSAQQENCSDAPKMSSKVSSDDASSLGDSSEDDCYLEDDESVSDGWPPKPPVCRFKRLLQFSHTFQGETESGKSFAKMVSDKKIKKKEKKHIEADFHDVTVTWVNHFFEMDIKTKSQLEQGYSVLVLFILDGIYPNKVPWRFVDWDLQYQRAQQKNFGILESVWADVNMDKARGFRVGDTYLRVENIQESNLRDKLNFLRLMKRWFDSRVQNTSTFDPIGRRQEIIQLCHIRGFKVTFPQWMLMERDEADTNRLIQRKSTFNTAAFNMMPEFKRLIWFLGSPEHQGM